MAVVVVVVVVGGAAAAVVDAAALARWAVLGAAASRVVVEARV